MCENLVAREYVGLQYTSLYIMRELKYSDIRLLKLAVVILGTIMQIFSFFFRHYVLLNKTSDKQFPRNGDEE